MPLPIGRKDPATPRSVMRERAMSLTWAAPFMVFFLLPLSAGWQVGPTTPQGLALIGSTALMASLYLAAWLINDPVPTDTSRQWRFLATLLALLASYAALHAAMLAVGYSGGAHFLAFLASPAVFLAPRRWLLPTVSAVVALTAFLSFVWPATDFTPIASVLMATVVCMASRGAIESERLREVQAAQDLALSKERERTRISADLHDILGQTLTGITVKADLAGRLLDAGRIDDARAQIDDLTEMSRVALADVREVVAGNRTLLPATELESATALLEAAGVRLVVERQGEPTPGAPATLVAHVIREACTNALRHARPTRVTVTLRSDGVRVVNDGVKQGFRGFGTSPSGAARASNDSADSSNLPRRGPGSGLEALRERAQGRATLTWGAEGDRWIVELKEGMSQ